MGLPNVIAYILVATLVAPALVDMGVDLMAAHLFVFYGAMLSSITPAASRKPPGTGASRCRWSYGTCHFSTCCRLSWTWPPTALRPSLPMRSMGTVSCRCSTAPTRVGRTRPHRVHRRLKNIQVTPKCCPSRENDRCVPGCRMAKSGAKVRIAVAPSTIHPGTTRIRPVSRRRAAPS